jgi:hypothetical protein
MAPIKAPEGIESILRNRFLKALESSLEEAALESKHEEMASAL